MNYLTRRLVTFPLVMLGVSVLVFISIRLVPGDAITAMLGTEAGLLTPPFGLLVYTVKGSVTDPTATLSKIFLGSAPYCVLIIVAAVIVIMFPALASWLPGLLF